MGECTQAQFAPFAFTSDGFNLHRHETPVDDVVVFVHGLNGHGYTTWRDFPGLVFKREADVAVFNYPTFLRRLTEWPPATSALGFYVGQLAHALQGLDGYERIHLVGHSLGGVVSELAARNVLEDHAMSVGGPLSQLASITYFASPRLGSGWAKGRPFEWLVREFRVLKRLSVTNAESERFFTKHVESDLREDKTERMFLPRFACFGGKDWFVSNFSTQFGVPEGQWLPLRDSHKWISKPTSENAPQFDWMFNNFRDVSSARQEIAQRIYHSRREAESPPQVPARHGLVTQFWGVLSGAWQDVYDEVCAESSTADVLVEDIQDARADAPVDLLISVSDASAVVAEHEFDMARTSEASSRAVSERQLSVGLAPVGPDFESAEEVLTRWLGPAAPPTVVVRGAEDAFELRATMTEWVQRVVHRKTAHRRALHIPTSSASVSTWDHDLIGGPT